MYFSPEFVATLPNKRPPAGIPSAHTFYYTGQPCKHGHMAPRYVSSGNCTACSVRTVARARIPGAHYVTFPLLLQDSELAVAFKADPTLVDKVGVILFNYRSLAEQLARWAILGWHGAGEPPTAPIPMDEPGPADGFIIKATDAVFEWGDLKTAGWTVAALQTALENGDIARV